MTRRQALEDLFLAVRKYLINEGRSEQTAHIVATAMWNKCADNDKMTVKDIKRVRDIFLQQEGSSMIRVRQYIKIYNRYPYADIKQRAFAKILEYVNKRCYK